MKLDQSGVRGFLIWIYAAMALVKYLLFCLQFQSEYCHNLCNYFSSSGRLLVQELWSLLEFMMPNLFATEDVDLKKLLTAENNSLINHMKFILGPFILRRLKSDVMQQLVPKIQQVGRSIF